MTAVGGARGIDTLKGRKSRKTHVRSLPPRI
jgi:hypothetical protein